MNAESILGCPPFCRPDGSPVQDLEDKFRGRKAVLVCGGPSFLTVDHSLIRSSGLITMTLNDGVRTFRSDLWLGVDPPERFDSTIWEDARITKFIPTGRAGDEHARRGVHVIVYPPSDAWCSEAIFSPTGTVAPFSRGDGARTSMVDAIRVLFLLGFRTIYLFGVDFHQSRAHAYHHPAPGYPRRVRANNRLYRRLTERLARMRPLMESAGLDVYNCNPDSRLEVFEKRDFPRGPAAE